MKPEYNQHDKLQLGPLIDEVALVGNHEAKFLLLMCLAQEQRLIDRSLLGQAFTEFIGPSAKRRLRNTALLNFCTQCLIPAGYVEAELSSDDKILGVVITQKGIDRGLPLVGGLGKISLDNQNHSVQRIFGPTHGNGPARPVQSRIAVMSEVYFGAGNVLSLSDISGTTHDKSNSGDREYAKRLGAIESAAELLEQNGLTHIDHASEINTRRYRINEVQTVKRNANVRPALKHLDEFIAQRLRTGMLDFLPEEFLTYSLSRHDAEGIVVDPADLRDEIMIMLFTVSNKKSPNQNPRLQDLGTYNNGSFTVVRPDEDSRQMVQNILGLLVRIADEEGSVLRYGKRQVWDIAGSESAKVQLLEKAYRFSSRKNFLPAHKALPKMIGLLLLREDAGLDVESAAALFRFVYDRPAGTGYSRRVLDLLVDHGLATVQKERFTDSRRETRNVYRLILPMSERALKAAGVALPF